MLDPTRNPYTPNAGSKPPELAGRDALLEQFRILLARLEEGLTEQSIIARGLRGVGKTVLLNAFEDMAEAEGFIVFYHELTPESSLARDVAQDVQAALKRLRLSRKALAELRDALSHLSTLKVTLADGTEIALDLKSRDEAALTYDLTELFLQVGKVAKGKGRGIVFLFDELQNAKAPEWRAVISALHRATQRSLPIAAAAAGLPQIPKLTGEARSYAERLFNFHFIGNLGEDAASTALVEPARLRGVKYSTKAVELALKWTEGYPFYIQQLGKHAWNLAVSSPIDADTVKRAIPLAQEALDNSIYEVRLQRASDFERIYMSAMASLGEGPYATGDIARKMGRTNKELSATRARLIEKGLIYATEDHGRLEFTVPRFDDFLRRRRPFQNPPPKHKRPPSNP